MNFSVLIELEYWTVSIVYTKIAVLQLFFVLIVCEENSW